MDESYKIKDTDQSKRMKSLALGGAYFNCGEIYKMLSEKELHRLIKKIKEGTIKLKSKLLYNKLEITNEEKFLENLDHYITYVKDHYHISCIEQFIIMNNGLDNKYAEKCLLMLKDFHSDENYYEYFNYFRRMFMLNFFNNIRYCHEKDKYKEFNSIQTAYNKIKNYDFDDDEDILELEKMFIGVIKARDNNLFNACHSFKKIRKNEELTFYISQMEWVLSDYFSDSVQDDYKIHSSDKIIETGTTKILFNIGRVNKDDPVIIEFGVFNKSVNSIKKDIVLSRKEFDNLYKTFTIIFENNSKCNKTIVFVDSSLKFSFDYSESHNYLDIIYELPHCCGDSYDVSLGEKELKKLYKIIKKAVDRSN